MHRKWNRRFTAGVAALAGVSLLGMAPAANAVAGPGSVTALSVSASPFSSGTTPATYSIGFRTSAAGALAAGTDTITVSGPSGTFPTTPGDYYVDAAGKKAFVTAVTASTPTSVTFDTPVAVAASTIVAAEARRSVPVATR